MAPALKKAELLGSLLDAIRAFFSWHGHHEAPTNQHEASATQADLLGEGPFI